MRITALLKILLLFLHSVAELIVTDNCVSFFILFMKGQKLHNRRMGEIASLHPNTFVDKETQGRNICSYSENTFVKHHLSDHSFWLIPRFSRRIGCHSIFNK